MSESYSTTNRTASDRRTSVLRTLALITGVAFLLVGVLGFIPGITSNYDELEFAGNTSNAQLLGLFNVSILHNIVHLLFGVAGLALAGTAIRAFNYLLWGGVIYLVLTVYGIVIDQSSDANFVPINTADNWLHFALGVGMIALAFVGRSADARNNVLTR